MFKSAFAIRLHEYDHINDYNKCLWLQVVSYNCLPHSNFNSIEVVDQYYVHWALTETLKSEVFHRVILSIFAYVFIKRLYKLQGDLSELFVTYCSKECCRFLPFSLGYLSLDGTWMTTYSIFLNDVAGVVWVIVRTFEPKCFAFYITVCCHLTTIQTKLKWKQREEVEWIPN